MIVYVLYRYDNSPDPSAGEYMSAIFETVEKAQNSLPNVEWRGFPAIAPGPGEEHGDDTWIGMFENEPVRIEAHFVL